jgi:hypothetical protein
MKTLIITILILFTAGMLFGCCTTKTLYVDGKQIGPCPAPFPVKAYAVSITDEATKKESRGLFIPEDQLDAFYANWDSLAIYCKECERLFSPKKE